MFKHHLWGLIVYSFLISILAGCASHYSLPVSPSETPVVQSASSQHELAGLMTINFNPDTLSASIEPSRELNWHLNATWYLLPPRCPDCIQIHVNSWDSVNSILNVDVAIKNPVLVIAYDVRGIVFGDNIGLTLKNEDGWIPLYDIPGGEGINPFIAYGKSVTKRAFVPFAVQSENFRIYLPIGSPIRYAIDVSVGGNCAEPYEINNFQQEELLETAGSSAHVSADVFDWQNDVDSVTLSCIEITGVSESPLAYSGGNTWEIDLVNNSGAVTGIYPSLIWASSSGSGSLAMYKKIQIVVSRTAGEYYETEPNDAPEQADELPMEYNPQTDSFDHTGAISESDADWYLINLVKGQLGVVVTCTDLHASDEITLGLYNSSLSLVEEKSTGTGIVAYVHTPAGVGDNAGKYYIQVTGNSYGHDYDLAPLRYPDFSEGFTYFEIEPNETPGTGTLMDVTYDPDTDMNNFTGVIPTYSDVDFFRVSVPQSGQLILHMMAYDCASNEDVSINLSDALQNSYASGLIHYQDGSICISSHVDPGDYYVKVFANTFTHRYVVEPIFITD